MDRRKFLKTATAVAVAGGIEMAASESSPVRKIMTVRGEIDATALGVMLPHEHLLVDFIGADRVSRERYEADTVFEAVLPYVQQAKKLGLGALAECTPDGIGRDAALMKRISVASGVHILTNTGCYNASDGKYLPAYAREESADTLAARWILEWTKGIEDTGIRPGFIKIGVNGAPLSAMDQKLVRAAAQTHLATGLVIASHTSSGSAALEELAILREEGVDGSAFIWVHAQAEPDTKCHRRVAEQRAWLEFDGISCETIAAHVTLVKENVYYGFLGRILVSHDAGWYAVGEPGGGAFRPFDALFTTFLPSLREAGFSDSDIQRVTRDNPHEAFAIRKRTV